MPFIHRPSSLLRPPRAAAGAAVLALVAAGSVAALVACGGSRAAPPAPLSPTYVLTGRGWGHGIGMSQYGAYGYAKHGWTYDRILAHYYPGTTLGPAPSNRVRVLLAQGKPAVTVTSSAPFAVVDGSRKTRTLAAGTFRIGAGPSLTNPAGARLATSGPLVFSPGGVALQLGASSYRGTLTVSSVAGKLQVVNTLGADAYVQGVVSREIPSEWDAAALQAQAVAARSYALANLHPTAAFDVYTDTRSQVYGGVAAETPATNEAVQVTAGEVVLSGDEVADTLFFSTSGGRTAAIQDVWPDAEPTPYLVAVPDPYDTLSPYHLWQPTAMTAARLDRLLGVPGALVDLRVAVNGSGRVGTLTAVGTAGKVAISGADARTRLGLRSSWFRFGVLGRLSTKTPTIAEGAVVTLTGVERALPHAVVQTRAPGGPWTVLAGVKPGAGGVFTVKVKPTATTDFRLAFGHAGGAFTRVVVQAGR